MAAKGRWKHKQIYEWKLNLKIVPTIALGNVGDENEIKHRAMRADLHVYRIAAPTQPSLVKNSEISFHKKI